MCKYLGRWLEVANAHAFRALTGTMTNVRKCLRDKHKKSTARTALTKNAAKNFGKKAVA